MADFMKILQQAQEMQGRFQKLQEELQQQTVKASSNWSATSTPPRFGSRARAPAWRPNGLRRPA